MAKRDEPRYKFLPKTYDYVYDENGRKAYVIASIEYFDLLMKKLEECECPDEE